jgi:hypothetical protein
MKPIKILGLAMMAALMAMALVGASSAMAEEDTALCSVDELVCAEKNLVKHAHITTLVGHPTLLITPAGTVKCDVLFLGDVLNKGLLAFAPEPLLISGNFTFSNCLLNNIKCIVQEENGPAHLSVLKLEPEGASRYVTILFHVECSGLNCRYNSGELIETEIGPLKSAETNGEATIKEAELIKESGLFCPSTAKLTTTTTPLSPVYLSS